MRRMKKVIALLLLVVFAANITGCRIALYMREVEEKAWVEEGSLVAEDALGSGIGSEGANAMEEPELSGTLKLQVFTNESANHADAWTNVVTAFEEATGISVTLIMGSQVNTQYSAAWLAGETPADIIWINGNGIADEEMKTSGTFYDLTEVLTEGNIYGTDAKISDKLNMGVVETYNGGMYYAPLLNSVQGMWYDTELVKKVPTNFEEFKAVSAELTGKGIAGMTYPGMYSEYSIWALIMPAVAAYGEEFFNKVASGDPGSFLDERFVSVMKRYEEYSKAGYIMKGSTAADHTSSQLSWLNREAGFITNGLWLEVEMQDYIPDDFHMAFCASPLITSDQTPTLIKTANNIAVAAKTKNLENALAFVRYIYRDDVQREFMSKYGYLSALKSLNYEDAELSQVAEGTLNYVNSGNVNVLSKSVNMHALLNNTFKQVVNDIASGEMTAEQACQALSDDAKR